MAVTTVDLGNVRGLQGPPGPKGDTGAQGPKGDTGPQGPKGDSSVGDGGLGFGQRWYDLISERQVNVTYTNTTGKPIQVIIAEAFATVMVNSTGVNKKPRPVQRVVAGDLKIDGVLVSTSAASSEAPASGVIVPPGSTYMLSVTGTNAGVKVWRELR
ncbi:hypothetical protein PT276_08205 [Orbaceae bacterium ESL0721]|nr:hypothetical protein [Orbaceae bacterium ESL0721]